MISMASLVMIVSTGVYILVQRQFIVAQTSCDIWISHAGELAKR